MPEELPIFRHSVLRAYFLKKYFLSVGNALFFTLTVQTVLTINGGSTFDATILPNVTSQKEFSRASDLEL
jgi:hypothetical protein